MLGFRRNGGKTPFPAARQANTLCIPRERRHQIRRPETVVGAMKTYRLAAWPQLRAPFDKIAYRRMLSDMSHRHVSVAQLMETSGLRRSEVRQFLGMLGAEHLLSEREGAEPDSL